jgi:hypothetical protein
MKIGDPYLPIMQTRNDIKSGIVHELGARCPLFTANGTSPGQRLVVVGDEALLREVADLAWQIPNLVTISGTLVLRASQHDLGLDRAQDTLRLGKADTDPQQVLKRILRRMDALNMIPIVTSSAA